MCIGNGSDKKELKIYNEEKGNPSQTRLNQITGDGIHLPKGTHAPKHAPKHSQTHNQAEPRCTGTENKGVPEQSEEELNQVKQERSGVSVEPTIGPHHPSRETRQEAASRAREV